MMVSAVYVVNLTRNATGEVTQQDNARDDAYVNYEFFASTTDMYLLDYRGARNKSTTTNATSTLIHGWQATTSPYFWDTGKFTIAGAEEVLVFFERGGIRSDNNGIVDWVVEVTPNGTDWYRAILTPLPVGDANIGATAGDIATTTSGTYTASATTTAAIAMDSATSTVGFKLNSTGFQAMRCIVNIHSAASEAYCRASAKW